MIASEREIRYCRIIQQHQAKKTALKKLGVNTFSHVGQADQIDHHLDHDLDHLDPSES